jgi:hypothetical protein
MANQSIYGIRRNRFLVYALVASGLLIPSCAKAQTTWTVAVDVSSMNKKPVYHVGPPAYNGTPSCKYTLADQIHPEALKVCQGDTVQWVATTNSATYDLYVYQEDADVLSSAGTSVSLVHVTPANPKDGAVISAHAAPGPHEYYVAVADQADPKGRLYVDDPKIIIGTGTKIDAEVSNRLKNILLEAHGLRALVDNDPSATKAAKEEAQDRERRIITDVGKLKELLELE